MRRKGRLTRLPQSALAVGLPWLLFLLTAAIGVDFGWHPDEEPTQLSPLRRALEDHPLKPGFYHYPGLGHQLNLLALLPKAAAGADREGLIEATAEKGFLIGLRLERIVLASLTVIWVYLLTRSLGGRRLTGGLAAVLVALSWEVIYHSRFVSPDALLMQLSVLSVLVMLRAEERLEETHWPILAAIAAALACAAKYPGGALLIPLVLVISRHETRLQIGALAAFGLSFLFTTPGMLLEPIVFWSDVAAMRSQYSEGWFSHTVSRPMHYLKIAEYLALEALSPFGAVAACFAGAAIIGLIVLHRRDPRSALVFTLFPLLYLGVFGTQKAMIVRNYLALIPFLAVLAALGVEQLLGKLSARRSRLLAASVLTLVLVAQAAWGLHAAIEIPTVSREQHLRRLGAYIDSRPDRTFFVSAPIRDQLAAATGADRPNVVDNALEPFDLAVVSLFELGEFFPANQRGSIQRSFGPKDLNLEYLPKWRGSDRPLVLTRARALESPLRAGQRFHWQWRPGATPAVRQRLLGDQRAGLDLVRQADGRFHFDLTSVGDQALRRPRFGQPSPTEDHRPFALNAGQAYDLRLDWNVPPGTVRVRLDGQQVLVAEHSLEEAPLEHLEIAASSRADLGATAVTAID